jgi:hypothetical protein
MSNAGSDAEVLTRVARRLSSESREAFFKAREASLISFDELPFEVAMAKLGEAIKLRRLAIGKQREALELRRLALGMLAREAANSAKAGGQAADALG